MNGIELALAIQSGERVYGTLVVSPSPFWAPKIKQLGLDFVFIDANHRFVDVAQDLTYWSRKVRKGGIVAGHDYTTARRYTAIHVKQVVHGFTEAYDIHPWFVLGADFHKTSRTFFWVVQ